MFDCLMYKKSLKSHLKKTKKNWEKFMYILFLKKVFKYFALSSVFCGHQAWEEPCVTGWAPGNLLPFS